MKKRSCFDFWTLAHGTHVEWALLLVALDESEVQFKRVGLATLYPDKIKGDRGTPVHFEII